MSMNSSRREFIMTSSVFLAGGLFRRAYGDGALLDEPVRFGLLTDAHYADRDAAGTRHYRDSLSKLNGAVDDMNGRDLDFAIELGDFKDQDEHQDKDNALGYLRRIESAFARFDGPRRHVLGNHDMDCLSKADFLGEVENTGFNKADAFYSFDAKGLHGVVLDANHCGDGASYDRGNFDWTDANIPADQIEWLKADLEQARGPVVVFIHQRLDGEGDLFVNNAAEIRKVLEESGKTLAVLQGHHHEGGYSRIQGIHYYTLRGMVEGPGLENTAYAAATCDEKGNLVITGYGKAVSKSCEA